MPELVNGKFVARWCIPPHILKEREEAQIEIQEILAEVRKKRALQQLGHNNPLKDDKAK